MDYRFMIKNRPLVEGELKRLDRRINIKTSGIKSEDGFNDKDLMDRYNDLIERKLRLEETLLDYDSSIELINQMMWLLNTEMPIEYEAIKMYYIDCQPISVLMKRLNFSKAQCWRYIKNGERELEKIYAIVK